MENDVYKRLYDAISRALSTGTQGGTFWDTMAEIDSILSIELTPCELKSLKLEPTEWDHIDSFVSRDHKPKKKLTHKFLTDLGIEDKLIRMKTIIEEKIIP